MKGENMKRLLAALAATAVLALAGCSSGDGLMTEQEAIAGIRESIQAEGTDAEIRQSLEDSCKILKMASENGLTVEETLKFMEGSVGVTSAMNLSIIQVYAVQSICPEYQEWFDSGTD